MKVSIGTKTKDGPWGGGNLFAINLKNFLEANGIKVVNNLKDDDIDLILITEPRKTSESSAFTHIQVINYLKYINSKALVVHRINECDERKNTNYINKYIIEANKVADHTVFVSSWLKNLYLNHGMENVNKEVILSGSDHEVFNSKNKLPWTKSEKLSLVTHHWGANWNKGFDVYEYIDNLLDKDKWNKLIEFKYIGNLPNKLKFKNTKVISPLSGKELVDQLKKSHVYITGSINEPSGNHHIEGALCGLPVLYLNSGGIPEYCEKFGLEYNLDNIEKKIIQIMDNYEKYFSLIEKYPFKAEKMSMDYLNLFNSMLENKEEILSNRKIKFRSHYLISSLYKKIKL